MRKPAPFLRRATAVLIGAALVTPALPVGAADPPSVTLGQQGVGYDAASNTALVDVTLTPQGLDAPWQYEVAVHGTVSRSGSVTEGVVTVSIANACSITSQSVTAQVTDAAGHAAGTAAILDRSMCPPPPDVDYTDDRILAAPTLSEASFIDRLRAVGSPALGQGGAIYRAFVAKGVNPAFALGMFHAESHSGTRGYAVTTRNWGNILYRDWTADYGAVPYAPGNGYTYASFPTWLAGARACAELLRRYHRKGYTTVSRATARWLGTRVGTTRHLRYLGNVAAVMALLPDDAAPRVTALAVPASSRSPVVVSWAARDNRAVTGYQLRTRRGSEAWSTPEPTTGRSAALDLATGTWTVSVRAVDAAGNWSSWRSATVSVDASPPTMTRLERSAFLVRRADGSMTASWGARDNVGVTRYQWRIRRDPDGPWSEPVSTADRSRALRLPAGAWTLAVRARDAVGNWSDWRETRFIVPVDDRAFAFSGGTIRRTGDAYFRGTSTITKLAGASVSTSFTGTGFYLVGTAGPAYGRMRITVDGASQVVDAGRYEGVRATRNHHRVVLYAIRLATGEHSVTITNLATAGRPAIAIDALGFDG